MSFPYIVLSYYTIRPLFKNKQPQYGNIRLSTDLGLTEIRVNSTEQGVEFPDGQVLPWSDLKKIYRHDNRSYVVTENQAVPISIFSETTNWVRTLYPTAKTPTTLVSGILMHRIKDIDPMNDTESKITALGKLKYGRVLDTSTGLGYSAILAAKHADSVTTVEIDPTALDIAKLNPYSQDLFTNEKITQIVGDIFEVMDTLDGTFTHIFHDPPTEKIAPELFTKELYQKFFDHLTSDGKLFHYIGDPNSLHGDTVTKKVIERLRQVGFAKIEPAPRAFGLVAYKVNH